MFTTTITDFHRDAVGDWVAQLACGHEQHVRHRPPWQLRPWVTTEAGRAERLGTDIDCPLCVMPTLPEAVRPYKRTTTFTEVTVSSGLLRDHHTKAGVWALIVVETGRLGYTLDSPAFTFVLTPERPGVIPPEIGHRVTVLGPVSFYVEFLRADQAEGPLPP